MLWACDFVALLENAINKGENIGDLFCQHIPSKFEPLYLYYCSRQTTSNNKLIQLLQNDPSVQLWHDQSSAKLQGLTNAWDLPSLLVKPFQRILKYPLLINNLIKCNQNNVPSLNNALTHLHSLAERINDAKFRKDSVDNALLMHMHTSDDSPARSPLIPSSTSMPNSFKKTPPMLPSKKSRTFLRRRSKSTTHPNSITTSIASSPIQSTQNLANEDMQQNGPPVYSQEHSIASNTIIRLLDSELHQLTLFTKNINDWLNTVSLELHQLAKLVGRWYATSSLDAFSHIKKVNGNENESTITIDAYARIIREIFKIPYGALVTQIDSRIHYRLKEIMKLSTNPHIIIARRNELKREFDDSVGMIPAKNRWSSTQLIFNAHEAFKSFHALDLQLRLELPVFIQGMRRALRGVVRDFIEIQTKFYEESAKLRQMWCEQWCTFNHEHTPQRIEKDWEIRFGIISDRLDKLNLQIAPSNDGRQSDMSERESDGMLKRRGESPSTNNVNTNVKILDTHRQSISDDMTNPETSAHASQRSSGIYMDSPPTPLSISNDKSNDKSHDKLPTPSFYTRMLPQLSLDSYRTAFSKQPTTDKLEDGNSISLSLSSFDVETDRLACVMQRDIEGLGLKLGGEESSRTYTNQDNAVFNEK
ncbi:hypothetical protein E3P92_01874 [Wallemia ichthyophaga]|uniref:DH domain-containing protein n=1 Tax=Wallemia ichthyophaga TaxID=245174 RepID=A0A4T0HFZ9_WALIC|nr:hypothetical protein E3P92_01874 [Wallemia ichthyophaga]TIB16001.1 hypothetical protein E3P90_00680 [Wallemia ichthyophaga]TIB17748.1 hypothetical protein E3P93_00537 [Wallemia ichthyophaga]TIB25491.1 hypothetical protein E3P89_00521 [Wallemia ichthyophaga]TIB27037.1 hypothetical protein E3P88_00549 [Wallemia ichthyophaga]